MINIPDSWREPF